GVTIGSTVTTDGFFDIFQDTRIRNAEYLYFQGSSGTAVASSIQSSTEGVLNISADRLNLSQAGRLTLSQSSSYGSIVWGTSSNFALGGGINGEIKIVCNTGGGTITGSGA